MSVWYRTASRQTLKKGRLNPSLRCSTLREGTLREGRNKGGQEGRKKGGRVGGSERKIGTDALVCARTVKPVCVLACMHAYNE